MNSSNSNQLQCILKTVNCSFLGYTGSSYYSHQGGGVDFVCLPSRPQFGRDTNETKSGAFMVGTEFQVSTVTNVPNEQNPDALTSP